MSEPWLEAGWFGGGEGQLSDFAGCTHMSNASWELADFSQAYLGVTLFCVSVILLGSIDFSNTSFSYDAKSTSV